VTTEQLDDIEREKAETNTPVICAQCESNARWNEAGGYRELAEKCREYCRNGHKERYL
jgi:hypothetical protein